MLLNMINSRVVECRATYSAKPFNTGQVSTKTMTGAAIFSKNFEDF